MIEFFRRIQNFILDRDVKDFIADIIFPIARLIISILVVLMYILLFKYQISSFALQATKDLVSFWKDQNPAPTSNLIPLIYFLHLAIPTGFILVLLLALIGNGRANEHVTPRSSKGLGWIWIVGVIGLIIPFAALLWVK